MGTKNMSNEEREALIAKLEGQSQWSWWSTRVEFLEREVETLEHWATSEDITKVCDGMRAIHDALAAELEKARKHFATLAEFAPAPKGRKKK